MTRLPLIGLDADDTLWHNERFYRLTQERFAAILADHASAEALSERLLEAERRNLARYGYGIKGFTLSMIETALDVAGDALPGAAIRRILDAARDMHDHPVEPLPHVREALAGMIDFASGDTEVDVERYRLLRRDMADHLRREGFGHARVYSRGFVDHDRKLIHFFYYVDEGPKTKVKSLVVEGNVKVPAETIIERSGLEEGQPFSWNDRFDGEFYLLDSGAFASTFIRADVDTKFYVPGDADDGGEIKDEQIDENGDLIPRDLPEAVDVKIHVVEAPSQQLRVRAGVELDPTRIDTVLGSRL